MHAYISVFNYLKHVLLIPTISNKFCLPVNEVYSVILILILSFKIKSYVQIILVKGLVYRIYTATWRFWTPFATQNADETHWHNRGRLFSLVGSNIGASILNTF